METLYWIVKFYQDPKKRSRRLNKVGQLTLAEAKRYCARPDTSGPGWFCGFIQVGA